MYIIDLEDEKLKDVLRYPEEHDTLGTLYCYTGKWGCTTIGRAYTNKDLTKLVILETQTREDSDFKGKPESQNILPKNEDWLRINDVSNY